MAANSTGAVLATPAAEFRLPATDGKTYALDDVAGEKGTVIVFICNHCPYVKAVIDRMVSDARVLMSEGVGFAAHADEARLSRAYADAQGPPRAPDRTDGDDAGPDARRMSQARLFARIAA
jgi:AhpC/TSA family